MEPLAVVGALASAAQLFDMSLKYSHRACNFVSAFKQSGEHAAVLQKSLQEVNALMRDLQRYIEEACRSSKMGPGQHSHVHHSIIDISRQFADDMVCLHELLPYDMTTFSASVRQRTRFVLREKDTERVVRRLESRKSAATLALELIGRLNEMSLQHGVMSLQAQVQLLSIQQNSLLENNLRHRDEGLERSRLYESQVVTSIQALHEMVARNAAETVSRQEVFAGDVASGISEVQAQVAVILARQNHILSSQRLQVAEAQAEVNYADLLARLIRLELRQQLEPLLDRIGGAREQIDRIVATFSTDAATKGVFREEKPPPVQTSAHDINSASLSGEAMLGALSSSSSVFGPSSMRPQEVFLSSVNHDIFTRVGILSITLRTYRLRGTRTDDQSTYFQLRVNIIPRPRLCSLGFSALYSSGPDHRGYFSICPSISIIHIFEHNSKVYEFMRNDDQLGFRLLVENGGVGIWDTSDIGTTLLELSVVLEAPSVCQYLLRDSGYGAQLAERASSSMLTISSEFLAPFVLHAEPHTGADVLRRLATYVIDEYEDDNDFELGWSNFYAVLRRLDLSTESKSHQMWHQAVSSARVLIEAGHILRPFDWLRAQELTQTIVLLDIYLMTDGDPNAPAPNGDPPLLFAMALIDSVNIKDTQTQSHEETDEHNCIKNRDASVSILSSLISAGADIYYIRSEQCSHVSAMTLTDYAFALEIDEIWGDALAKCGLDPTVVYEQSDSRLADYRKLYGASRTGVDVESITARPDVSGLRQRDTSRRIKEIFED